MPDPTPDLISQALSDYHAGIFPSYRAAGRAYNIPHTTLARRDKGITTMRSDAHASQKVLPKELERLVSDWILYCEAAGHHLSHAQIREFVLLMLRSIKQPESIGTNWVPRFLHRRGELATTLRRKSAVQRSGSANGEAPKT